MTPFRYSTEAWQRQARRYQRLAEMRRDKEARHHHPPTRILMQRTIQLALLLSACVGWLLWALGDLPHF